MLSTPKSWTSSPARLGRKGQCPWAAHRPGFGLRCSFPPPDLAQDLPGAQLPYKPPQNLMLSHKMKNLVFYYFFRTSSLLTYKIPVADALPLSRSFSKLEAGKRKQSVKSGNHFQIVCMDLVFKDAFSIPPQLNGISSLRSTACH